MLLVFCAWMTFTSFFALEPDLVWREWNRVIKTMFMIFVSLTVLNTERDIKQFAWVVALSLGIYGLKGGLFVLVSGGSYKVYLARRAVISKKTMAWRWRWSRPCR